MIMERKRILILTLGTGPKDINYKMTQYSMEGVLYKRGGVAKETPFVAEPVIYNYKPDMIIFLGTVKSVWHQFYSALTDRLDENYHRLVDIEYNNGYGYKTESKDLKSIGEEITGIYKKISSWEKYSEKYNDTVPDVHVLLTKYGIDGNELKENYGILKCIEKFLEEDKSYEVAFDITHSFRSLPIYNLVIFNYIKNVTKHDIIISHVYYGNMDARHELVGNVAPIVDLKDLVDVLDLTNGVTEFKNSGNAESLLDYTKEDKELSDRLRDFDLATQLNDFLNIKQSLNKLEEITETQSVENRYTGVREMISTVLQEKFKKDDEKSFSDYSDIDLKFMLMEWFFNQNRMGLGLATGLEVLRDINTPAFMAARGKGTQNERGYRENAENYFIVIAEVLSKRTSKPLSILEQTVCSLGTKLKRYKEIRNMFAHSLSDQSDRTINDIREEVLTFEKDIIKLKSVYDSNREVYNALFEISKKPKVEKRNNNCRIILEFNGKCDDYGRFQSSKKKQYDVYCMSDKAYSNFISRIDKNNAIEKAYFLTEYVKKQMQIDYDEIQIMYNCKDPEKEVIFRIFLEQIVNDNDKIKLYQITGDGYSECGKIGVHISIDEHEKELVSKEKVYAEAMQEPLQLVIK